MCIRTVHREAGKRRISPPTPGPPGSRFAPEGTIPALLGYWLHRLKRPQSGSRESGVSPWDGIREGARAQGLSPGLPTQRGPGGCRQALASQYLPLWPKGLSHLLSCTPAPPLSPPILQNWDQCGLSSSHLSRNQWGRLALRCILSCPELVPQFLPTETSPSQPPCHLDFRGQWEPLPHPLPQVFPYTSSWRRKSEGKHRESTR